MNPAIKMILAELLKGKKDQTLQDQSAPVHAIERILTYWLQKKKAAFALAGRVGRLVLMMDEAGDTLRMVPCVMEPPGSLPVPADELLAVTDAAFRSISLAEKDPDRVEHIKTIHAIVRYMVERGRDGMIIREMLIEEGLSVTAMSQSVPFSEVALSMLDTMTLGAEELTEAQQQQIADTVLDVLQTAARQPQCRLFSKKKYAEASALPEPPAPSEADLLKEQHADAGQQPTTEDPPQPVGEATAPEPAPQAEQEAFNPHTHRRNKI